MWPINNALSLAYCAPIFYLNEDIVFLICERLISEPTPADDRLAHAKAFSETCQRFRYMAAPIILYNVKLRMDQDRISATLQTLERCQYSKNCIRRVSIEDPNLPSAMLVRGLARALNGIKSLTSMESLIMDLVLPRWSDMRSDFLEEVGAFPQVKELRLCAELAPLAERCVNVTSLFGILLPSDWTIIDATRQMNNIQRFDLKAYWEPEHLEALLNARPDLRELGMLSFENLGYERVQYAPRSSDEKNGKAYRGDFRSMLAVLAQFWNLRTLAITEVPRLYPYPYEPYEKDPTIEVPELPVQRLQDIVVNNVFCACRALKVLWIGESIRATVVRDSLGGVDGVMIGYGKRRAVAERR
ncbi:Hypothetical predicted protein [Lecanosticta acicola]|uniref:Uncharacterized protein n=1 Tax=Lecanosticta acicola TaxID=111012 RepID=A0AAI8Z5B7_9PEZI|nr:Hypothetical predicted protein [Lecanosticta acicola]